MGPPAASVNICDGFLYPDISRSIAQQQTTTENEDRIRISISLTVVYL